MLKTKVNILAQGLNFKSPIPATMPGMELTTKNPQMKEPMVINSGSTSTGAAAPGDSSAMVPAPKRTKKTSKPVANPMALYAMKRIPKTVTFFSTLLSPVQD